MEYARQSSKKCSKTTAQLGYIFDISDASEENAMWKDIKITFVRGQNSSHEEYLLFDRSQPNIYASMAEVMTSIENKLDFISNTILQDYLVDTGIYEIHQRIKDSYLTLDETPGFSYREEACNKFMDKYSSLDINSLKPSINRTIQEYEASEYFGPLMDSLKLVFLQKSAIDLAIKNFLVAEKPPMPVNVAKNPKLAPSNKTIQKITAQLTSESREKSFSKITRTNTLTKPSSRPKNKQNKDSRGDSSGNDRAKFAGDRDLEGFDSDEFEDNPAFKRYETFIVSPRSNSKKQKSGRRDERNSSFRAEDQSRGSSKDHAKLKSISKGTKSRNQSRSKSRNQSFSKDREVQKAESPSKFPQKVFKEDMGNGYSKIHNKAIERRVDEIMTRRERKEAILRDMKERPEEKGWFRDACQCVTW